MLNYTLRARYALACLVLQVALGNPTTLFNTNLKCKMGPWSAWSTCSKPCYGGKQKRTRKIMNIPKPLTRKDCPSTKGTRSCNEDVFCYEFALDGGDGTEVVEIINDGKRELVNLKAGWQTIGVNDPHVQVNFVTGVTTTLPRKPTDLAVTFGASGPESESYDGPMPEDQSHFVLFKWGQNRPLGADRCDRISADPRTDPVHPGCRGDAPTLPYLWDDWKCGDDDQDRMCTVVQAGWWIWAGVYEFTFKTSLPPTAAPMPAPTPGNEGATSTKNSSN